MKCKLADLSERDRTMTFSSDQILTALDRKEFRVVYQPQVLAATGKIVSVEALVRWMHPQRGIIGPFEFINQIETIGTMGRLTDYVLEQACTDAAAWPALGVAVNFSPSQFSNAAVVETIKRIVAATGFDIRRLEVEIVESAVFDDRAVALQRINELRALGATVALDDFGTGYSSLQMLQEMPFDKVKIDKSFVDGIPAVRSVAIVHAIVALVRALGMKVTAEGVETAEQRAFLKAAGCHYLQGYLFSRPVPAAAIMRLLGEQAGAAAA